MSNVPPLPPEPSGPVTDKVSETARRAVEAAGGAPLPDSSPPTVVSDYPDSPHPAIADPRRIGDYAVLKKIGEGGMGAVYLAEDTKLGRKVAIKTMKRELAANKSDRDRFVREARAAAAVEHDNIVPILHIGEASDGSPFIAMPFLQGEMLDARLKRQPVAGLGVILKVAREVSEGLAAAHAKGLIHRDIKPGNVWLEGDLTSKEPTQQLRRCKILDFGLARSVGTEDAQITASGVIIGTPAYMAPEQARGEKADHRADLFSLGVTLYRMATGKLPFNGPTSMAVLIALTTDTPIPARTLNPNLPRAITDLIDRLMSKDPAGRPQSANAVLSTLRQIVKDLQTKKSSAEIPTPPVQVAALPNAAEVSSSQPRVLPVPSEEVTESDSDSLPRAAEIRSAARAKPKSNRVLWAAGIALALALGGVAVWLATRGDKPDPEVVKKEDPPTVEPKKDPDSDRKAAERTFTLGGVVRVNGEGTDIKDVANLPKEQFDLTSVDLQHSPRVTDDDLRTFANCASLTRLVLWDTKVTDAGLANFKGTTSLRALDLTGTRVTDDGLIHFKNCTNLDYLCLNNTQIGDAGLAHFKGCTAITNVGLWNTKVTDDGLATLKEFSALRELGLLGTKVTGPGLAHLAACRQLASLGLSDTGVGDPGLKYLIGCQSLTYCGLQNSKVTEPGVRELAKALPGCKIEYNGGIIEPKGPNLDADRKAAAYVQSLGGRLTIRQGDVDKALTAKDPLPADPWTLVGIDLARTSVTDAGLANFAGCVELTTIDIGHTGIGDAGVIHFKGCKKLKELLIGSTQITDDGFAHFKGCKELTLCGITNTQVSDAILETCKDLTALKNLDLRNTKVAGSGAKKIAAALPGCRIGWGNAEVIEPTLTADRKAAAWVLSVGGSIGLDGELSGIKAVADLPKEPFRLTAVSLGNAKPTDADLAVFRECRHLTLLSITQGAVTDAGLAHFAHLTTLESLSLSSLPEATDAGLDHFKNCTELRTLILWNAPFGGKGLPALARFTKLNHLELMGTRVTDAGLACLESLPKLTKLSLTRTAITDRGMAHLKACPQLRTLLFQNTTVTDAGLAHLKGLTELRDIAVSENITDKGVAHLKDLTKLESLLLARSATTDAGLEHLKGLAELRTLYLQGTKVTQEGVANIRKALPGCNIEWDAPKDEVPKLDPAAERKAAEWVLAAGGTVEVNGNRKQIKAVADLPKGLVRLTDVTLTVPTKDEDLAVFKGCTNLTGLYLVGTGITAEGLAHFAGCKNLTNLNLSGTKVDDAGLNTIKQFTKLADLSVGVTSITPKGVQELAKALPGCRIQHDGGTIKPKVENLDADRKAAQWILANGGTVFINGDPQVIAAANQLPNEPFRLTEYLFARPETLTDATAANFAGCDHLTILRFNGTKLSDTGAAHFKGCKNLTQLTLSRTAVTDAGLAHFVGCKSLTYIVLDNTAVSDAGLKHFKDCANLTHLDVATTQVGDEGFAHFAGCKNLTLLNASRTRVTDAGLVHFVGCKNLTDLLLVNTGITDSGLAHLKDHKGLTRVNLHSTKVTDAGVAHLKGNKDLNSLWLADTEVTDAGLGHLKDLSHLQLLFVRGSKVSAKGVADLAKALPQCKIEWDGGTIAPTKK